MLESEAERCLFVFYNRDSQLVAITRFRTFSRAHAYFAHCTIPILTYGSPPSQASLLYVVMEIIHRFSQS